MNINYLHVTRPAAHRLRGHRKALRWLPSATVAPLDGHGKFRR